MLHFLSFAVAYRVVSSAYLLSVINAANHIILHLFRNTTNLGLLAVSSMGYPIAKKIVAFDNWCLKRILHIHWTDFVYDEVVRSRTG